MTWVGSIGGICEGLLASMSLNISNPKRNQKLDSRWDAFFPYYAGYPTRFARELLGSMVESVDAVVLDPWNGSGTTPYAASLLGMKSIALDINPVMVVVSKARLLPKVAGPELLALGERVLASYSEMGEVAISGDPLSTWFEGRSVNRLRRLELAIRSVGPYEPQKGLSLLASPVAALYIALFCVARSAVKPLRSSNPTWIRAPRNDEKKISLSSDELCQGFGRTIKEMSEAVVDGGVCISASGRSHVTSGDSTNMEIESGSVDFVLTSPPYCTRIDYATKTRIELAILSPLVPNLHEHLGRQMMGSVRVSGVAMTAKESWGDACNEFLQKVATHPSKASGTYYLKTHLDYFNKLDRSLSEISRVLKDGGSATLVVQDSFYKDVHNDLARITVEMASSHDLRLEHLVEFPLRRSMALINSKARAYRGDARGVESVIIVKKELNNV